ncbi:MAG: hypothetical protein NT150_01290 [Bacteroidetes bacterium]|nr:hypothetical protein [Bacteroidota bacterium]
MTGSVTPEADRTATTNTKMSIAECRKVFGERAKDCDDATVKKMRDWLYQMSALALDLVKENSITSVDDLKRVLEEKNKGKPI